MTENTSASREYCPNLFQDRVDQGQYDAFGLSENKVIFDYVLRIAVLPTLTVLGIGIGQLLSGAVFAEIVFARPGIGKLVYDAILTRNYPIVSGTVLVTTFFFVLVNVLADLMIAWLDPRVRHGLQR